jgi:hypothetical protein
MTNSDGKETDVFLSKGRQDAFKKCLGDANEKRSKTGLRTVTYSRPMSNNHIENLKKYLTIEQGVESVDDLYSYDAMAKAQEVLCRWPRPSELASLAHKYDVNADTSYFTGIMYVDGKDVPMLVGKNASVFSELTQQHDLLYMWMSSTPSIPKGSDLRKITINSRPNNDTQRCIFVYGKDRSQVIQAMENIYNGIIPHLQSTNKEVYATLNKFIVTKRNLENRKEPFEYEFAEDERRDFPPLNNSDSSNAYSYASSNTDFIYDEKDDLEVGEFNPDGSSILSPEKTWEFMENYLDEIPRPLPKFVTNYMNQNQLPEENRTTNGKYNRRKTSTAKGNQKKKSADTRITREEDAKKEEKQKWKVLFQNQGYSNRDATRKASEQVKAQRNSSRGMSKKSTSYLTNANNTKAGELNAFDELEKNGNSTNNANNANNSNTEQTAQPFDSTNFDKDFPELGKKSGGAIKKKARGSPRAIKTTKKK